VQATVTRKGNGKLGWKILEVGGGVESASTQTLVLKLTPAWKMQDGTVVTDPLIAATLPAAGGGWRAEHAAEDAGQATQPAAGGAEGSDPGRVADRLAEDDA
jgi:hypothetical protein